ncbi:MAG: hypothetical protein GBAus27B_000225 [Mycoplasmataceae bacterium]|nr:MAG: hypothetical protein GBAus27B_000225 [Mycoplasmataceae bacterium]
MNNLNNSIDLKSLVINTFQEILTEDPNFFFTDKLSILTWKSKKIEGALITKIGNRRYLGLIRKDSQGQEYWKYKPLTKHSETEQSELEIATQHNSLVKETTKDHGNNKSTEASVNP